MKIFTERMFREELVRRQDEYMRERYMMERLERLENHIATLEERICEMEKTFGYDQRGGAKK